ncbi:MAG: ABC transporter permease [Thermoanaerobaculia bacterium]|jgi:putative ABC transport system permease protein
MNTSRLITHSARAMARYKLRSAFIILGSFIGTAALTLVVAVGEGAERKIMSTVRQIFGASSIIVMAGGTNMMAAPGANAARLTIDDLEAIAEAVPEVESWDPQQILPGASVRHEGATATAFVRGQSERAEHVWQREVTRGAWFDRTDVRESARVALIGETTAKELFGTADPLGAEILVGAVPLRVVGVLEPFGTDVHGMDRDDEIVVPISTMMRRMLNVDTIAAAKLLVRDPSQVDAAGAAVRRILRERHAVPAERPDDFTLVTAVTVRQMVARAKNVLNLYLPLVAGITLLAAAAVAAALMLASVNERVGEIGLRRAVGARVEDIQLQFVVETAVTILGGGLLGVVAGTIAAEAIAARLELGQLLSWRAVLIGLAVSIVTGVLAGLLPARRAARLDPVEALR